jgi:hypothetical protein
MDLALWTGDLEFAKINAAEAGDDTLLRNTEEVVAQNRGIRGASSS